jgi:hypothetical protein
MRITAVMAVTLAACGSGTTPVLAVLTLPGGGVFDPKLEGAAMPLHLDLVSAPEETCQVTWQVADRLGRASAWSPPSPVTLTAGAVDLAWDGRLDDGLAAEPGPIDVTAIVDCNGETATTTAGGWIVRVGVVEVELLAHPQDGGRVALAYHKVDAATPGVTVIGPDVPAYRVGASPYDAGDLDENDGAARATLAPWRSPDYPPWGAGDASVGNHNLPAAYQVGARARLTVTPGSWAVSPRTGVPLAALGPQALAADAPRLRLAPVGLTPVDPLATLVPGTPVSFDSAPLPDVLGRIELVVPWHFQAEQADGTWIDLPGHMTTVHRVYVVAGPPAIRDGSTMGAAPPVPWIGALEDLDAAVSGIAPDPVSVLTAVREYIHQNRYLQYDPGDAAYTDYTGQYIYWDYISLDLTGWLDRDDGIALYCHSVSCLFSSLAGHLGIDAPQYVLGVGFTTNYVRAAGSEEWRTWGFNSHSVISADGGAHLWDASIDMDGDSNPSALPAEALAPSGLTQAEYLSRLTNDPISVVNEGSCYIY